MDGLVYEEFEVRLADGSHPREVMVEVTRRCNLSCLYCFRDMLKPGYLIDMDKALYERFLEDAVSSGVEKLAFTGWGEPLIHPDILDFIGLAKEAGLKVLLNTNGFYLSEYGYKIVELGVDELVISIDSDDEDIYRNIRRGGDLKRIVEGLSVINDAKVSLGSDRPLMKFQYTLSRANINNLLSLARLAKEYRVKDVIVSNIIPNNPVTARMLLCLGDGGCIESIKSIMEDLTRVTLDTNINFYLPNMEVRTERHCPFMDKYAFYLTAEGDVAPCIYYAHEWRPIINGIERSISPVRFGNIRDRSILDIWKSTDYVRFRFNVRFSYMPSCLDCSLEDVCSITRSNEYDCWGNSPTCSHCPYARNIVSCPL